MQDFQETLKFTGLPTKDGDAATSNDTSATWFETRHYFSNLNKKMEVSHLPNSLNMQNAYANAHGMNSEISIFPVKKHTS